MKKSEKNIPGEWGLGRWLLLGASGVILAVAIALAAGNLANRPVGLSGEPVSAGSALEPPGSTVPAVQRKRQALPSAVVPPAPAPSGGSVPSSPAVPNYGSPAQPQAEPPPPANTSDPDDSTREGAGGEVESSDEDD